MSSFDRGPLSTKTTASTPPPMPRPRRRRRTQKERSAETRGLLLEATVECLAELGYHVAASTGRAETHAYLRDLGAAEIIDRAELAEPPTKPLDSQRWAGCIDAVGGPMLARVLGQMKYGASVAAVGLAGGAALPATVIPFLLRGVNLLGIDSVMKPYDGRLKAWERLAKDLPMDKLDAMIQPATLEDLPGLGADILKGQVKGRVVVDVNA